MKVEACIVFRGQVLQSGINQRKGNGQHDGRKEHRTSCEHTGLNGRNTVSSMIGGGPAFDFGLRSIAGGATIGQKAQGDGSYETHGNSPI